MMKTVAHAIALVLYLCIASSCANEAKFAVSVDGKKIRITGASGNVLTRVFDDLITRVDADARERFAGIHLAPRALSGKFVLLDCDSNEMYTGFTNASNERTWSKTGAYAYLKKNDEFYVIRNRALRAFVKGTADSSDYIRVKGNVLGAISQEAWEDDDALIFESGVGELECWGLLSTNDKRVTFLGCCGVGPGGGLDSADCQADQPWKRIVAESKSGVRTPQRCGPDFGACVESILRMQSERR